ncbi:MAG: hypothetical protein K2I36_00915 [Ureaplasma sp.]|nr:hypothetical protein [Ureaplasma sp.]
MNQILKSTDKIVKKIFDSQISIFKKTLKNNYNLNNFLNLFNIDFTQNLIKFSNYLIYFSYHEKTINQDDKFNLKYQDILKSIWLLSLAILNNYTTNIFKYDFVGKHNPFLISNKYNIDNEWFASLKNSTNNIFSYTYCLHELLAYNIPIQLFYELVLDIVILFMINNSNHNKIKHFIFFSFKSKKYTEQNTTLYLNVFKNVRNFLQKYFPNNFNELILLLNTFL